MSTPEATLSSAPTVLVVDDERNIRTTMRMCLEALGCVVIEAGSVEAALAAVLRAPVDLAFVDLRLGTESGLDLLPRLLGERADLDVVIITAWSTVEVAVQAIHRGAADFLPKPFTPAQVRLVVERLGERRALVREVERLRQGDGSGIEGVELTAHSPRMRAALDLVTQAAAFNVPVLLTGENGTGKSVLARRLHGLSTRRDRPFVVVNCPTLTGDLLASELFGHARGAFTGAVRDQAGRVEAAEGGTLFLDEVAEIAPPLQAKLLHFLQDKTYEPVGDTRTRTADVRIVAATNRDLEAEVAAGRFRQDLLYRLNTVEVALPPLRDRREDILPLARHFAARFAIAAHRRPPRLAPDAEAALVSYPWPGNLRELRNAVERAVILGVGEEISAERLPERIVARGGGAPWVGGPFTLEAIEREHVLRVLAAAPSLDAAAATLGIDPSTLWRKRKKLDEEK